MTDNDPGDDGPRIFRPIPRRPFNLNFSAPTPPDEDDDVSSPRPQITASDLQFLNPHQHAVTTPGLRDGSTPLSHTASYLNLTSPTLFGIYSPSTIGGAFTKDDDDPDPDFPNRADLHAASAVDTPLDSPAPRPGLDEATYSLMRERASAAHYPSSLSSSPATLAAGAAATAARSAASGAGPSRRRKREVALQLTLRAALLFALGVGYGVLVTRLPQQHGSLHQHHRHLAAYETAYEWCYLAFWGVAGVALGSLLPWFDRFWEEKTTGTTTSRGKRTSATSKPTPSTTTTTTETPSKPSPRAETDWALVVRGIGAFVGIVFALRKLPWASTMQVSLTLALANPFLWYLIDRSKPGFLLSAAVGLAGSALLMGLNPDVMPSPASAASAAAAASVPAGVVGGGNATGGEFELGGAGTVGGGFYGLASQETIETSIWMLSVLFCSCVCFGNIGRRLALSSSAAGRGRWGGVR